MASSLELKFRVMLDKGSPLEKYSKHMHKCSTYFVLSNNNIEYLSLEWWQYVLYYKELKCMKRKNVKIKESMWPCMACKSKFLHRQIQEGFHSLFSKGLIDCEENTGVLSPIFGNHSIILFIHQRIILVSVYNDFLCFCCFPTIDNVHLNDSL